MTILTEILKYFNAIIEQSKLYERVYGLSEYSEKEKRYIRYIGDGQYEQLHDFDRYAGTFFWIKPTKTLISPDANRIDGCLTDIKVQFNLRSIAIIQKKLLKCDAADSVDYLALTTLKSLQNSEKQLQKVLGLKSITLAGVSYEGKVKDIKDDKNYVQVAIDFTLTISARQECFNNDICIDTSKIPIEIVKKACVDILVEGEQLPNPLTANFVAGNNVTIEIDIDGNIVISATGGGGGSGVQSVTDDGNGVVSVDNTDPANPIIEFNGVNVDGVTITGDGTAGNPLKAKLIGGKSLDLFLDSPDQTYVATPLNGDILLSPITTTQTQVTSTDNNNTRNVINFISPPDFFTDTVIPDGFWWLHLFGSRNNGNVSFYFDVYYVDNDGVSNKTLIVSGAADPVPITNSSPIMLSQSLYQNTIIVLPNTNKRLIIEIFVITGAGNRTTTFYFRDNAYSHIHTPLVLPSGGTPLTIKENGTTVDSNVDEINFLGPLQAVQTAAGKVTVGLNNTAIISGLMLELLRFGDIGNSSRTIVYLPSQDKLYVFNATNLVSIYDATTAERLANVSAGNGSGLEYISSINEIWAKGAGNQIVRIDPVTNASLGTLAITLNNTGIARMIEYLATGNDRVFIFYAVNVSTISIRDLVTNTNSSINFSTTNACYWAALCSNPLSAMNNHIVVTRSAGFAVIDADTNSVVVNLDTTGFAATGDLWAGIDYSPSLDVFIIACTNQNRVVYLQPATASTFTVIRTLHYLSKPSLLRIDETNGLLLVVCNPTPNGNLTLSKIDLITGDPLGNILLSNTSNSPFNYIDIDPANRFAYVVATNTTAGANTPVVKVKY